MYAILTTTNCNLFCILGNANLALLPSRKKPGGNNPAIYPTPTIEATGSFIVIQ
jgi:hypothetical protein